MIISLWGLLKKRKKIVYSEINLKLGKIQCEWKNTKEKKTHTHTHNLRTSKFRRTDRKPEFVELKKIGVCLIKVNLNSGIGNMHITDNNMEIRSPRITYLFLIFYWCSSRWFPDRNNGRFCFVRHVDRFLLWRHCYQ